jgi:hypothetical protein
MNISDADPETFHVVIYTPALEAFSRHERTDSVLAWLRQPCRLS